MKNIKDIIKIVNNVSDELDRIRSQQYINQVTNDELDKRAKKSLIKKLSDINLSIDEAMEQVEEALDVDPDDQSLNEVFSFLDYYLLD